MLLVLVPLAVLWIGKLIVDEVVHAIAVHGQGGPIAWARLATLVGIELAIALVGEGLSRLSALLESLLGDLFANRTSIQLMQQREGDIASVGTKIPDEGFSWSLFSIP